MKLARFRISRAEVNELLLATYLGWLALSKYFSSLLQSDSTLILALPVTAILVLTLIINYKTRWFRRTPLIIAITLAIFCYSMLIFPNSTVPNYLYNFLIYGIIPLYILAYIPALRKFFEYFAYIGIVILLVFALDPINGYAITGDYMVYGYYVMLPIFTAFYIARKYFNVRWLFIFELVTFILITAFANRGALLAAVSLIVLTNLLVDKINTRKTVVFALASVVLVVSVINIKPILEWGIDATQDTGGSSYALETIYKSIEGDTNGLSGRDNLWGQVPALFEKGPMLGNGIAAFQDKHEIYTHNIFLEILVSFGILGIMWALLYVSLYLYKMVKSDRPNRLPYVLGISIGLVPLLFSMQPFIWYFFWIFTINLSQKITLPNEDRRE